MTSKSSSTKTLWQLFMGFLSDKKIQSAIVAFILAGITSITVVAVTGPPVAPYAQVILTDGQELYLTESDPVLNVTVLGAKENTFVKVYYPNGTIYQFGLTTQSFNITDEGTYNIVSQDTRGLTLLDITVYVYFRYDYIYTSREPEQLEYLTVDNQSYTFDFTIDGLTNISLNNVSISQNFTINDSGYYEVTGDTWYNESVILDTFSVVQIPFFNVSGITDYIMNGVDNGSRWFDYLELPVTYYACQPQYRVESTLEHREVLGWTNFTGNITTYSNYWWSFRGVSDTNQTIGATTVGISGKLGYTSASWYPNMTVKVGSGDPSLQHWIEAYCNYSGSIHMGEMFTTAVGKNDAYQDYVLYMDYPLHIQDDTTLNWTIFMSSMFKHQMAAPSTHPFADPFGRYTSPPHTPEYDWWQYNGGFMNQTHDLPYYLSSYEYIENDTILNQFYNASNAELLKCNNTNGVGNTSAISLNWYGDYSWTYNRSYLNPISIGSSGSRQTANSGNAANGSIYLPLYLASDELIWIGFEHKAWLSELDTDVVFTPLMFYAWDGLQTYTTKIVYLIVTFV
jgi:hypothetical protein